MKSTLLVVTVHPVDRVELLPVDDFAVRFLLGVGV